MRKYKNKNSFGVIPNRMFAWGTDSWCSNDEKMVYLELWFSQLISEMGESTDNKVITTNIDMLTHRLDWRTTSRESIGYTRVVHSLNSLRNKGYIIFKGEDLSARNLKTFDIIVLGMDYDTVVEINVDWSAKTRKFQGYSKLMADEYNMLKEGKYDLTLYLYAQWRENVGYKISYVEWSNVLGVSDRHVKRIVSGTEVLTKVQGQFNKELSKNETNSYKAKTDSKKQAKKASEQVVETPVVKEQETQTVVAENATEGVVSNVKEPLVENEKVVSENEASLSQSEIEKQQMASDNEKTKETKQEVSSFISDEVSAFDKLLNELEEDEEENTIDLFKAKEQKNKMLESQMRKVTDLKVKDNVELFKQIQDKAVPMTYEAYKIIKESDDYRIRKYGKEKIKAISKSKFGLKTIIEFENRYNKIKKVGAL
ncbi:hypothetical protein ITX49_14660 [Enterococcus casseliflavus]|uniref:hypothetical protein n=1 Tax=Enterococcus TaxID=1350 RepID=UPI001CBD7DBD|nr:MULTISPECIES: hypothetical protein [Enterococcus]MBZ3642421.1 hypothetical protein [Enterococcus casseliflavus]MCD5185853.1 hypothetical protein [Enterococcus gallinarum]